jgi:phosphohistidine phosphatase SixA
LPALPEVKASRQHLPSSARLAPSRLGGLKDGLVSAAGEHGSGLKNTAHMKRLVLAALAIWLLAARVAAADDSQEAWAALVDGSHVALIRHGNAPPGYGDPPGFKIDDCATQRNLDEKGRAQARALGEAFRQHGVRADKILSSPWCRCLETARLMVLGPVDGTWAVAASAKSPERLAALRQMLADWRGPGTLVVVTHALTVQALVGIMPGQAETVVVRPKLGKEPGVEIVGRIPVPE